MGTPTPVFKINRNMVLKIKKGTKQIDPHQYEGRLDIEELIIADTVEVIGNGAFQGCINLKKITWGANVHSIGNYAFLHCRSLKTLYLPNSIKCIGHVAIGYCTGLYYVEFEDDNEVEIWTSVFVFCTGLVCIILPNRYKRIHEFSFCGCSKLEDVFIPGSVTGIGYGAFQGVAAEEIELPDSIETIDRCAFSNSKLTRIVIPDSVLAIGESAFELCDDLRSVEISKSVVCIRKKAFENCSVLSEVTFKSTIIGSIGTSVFKGCKNLNRINVPVSAMDTYKRLLPKYLHRKLVGF